jgi:Sensors of blue-light using FAD
MGHDPHLDDELRHGGDPLLYMLTYCSRAADGLGDEDITRILASARRRNPVLGITGVLVYGGGLFFQMLEGPRDHVVRLMDLLRVDPRHGGIVVLNEMEDVRERLFPEWDMELTTSDSIRDVLLDARDEAATGAQAQALEEMLAQLDAGELGGP